MPHILVKFDEEHDGEDVDPVRQTVLELAQILCENGFQSSQK